MKMWMQFRTLKEDDETIRKNDVMTEFSKPNVHITYSRPTSEIFCIRAVGPYRRVRPLR